ncbi:MAG: hypothetical protein LBP86_12175, partial [Azoarcus sp.]|nr:hypothetical protein [Azoarcus sp.]
SARRGKRRAKTARRRPAGKICGSYGGEVYSSKPARNSPAQSSGYTLRSQGSGAEWESKVSDKPAWLILVESGVLKKYPKEILNKLIFRRSKNTTF